MNRITLLLGFKKLLLTACFSGLCFTVTANGLTQIDMQENWGVQPVHIRVTADGYMIEFRYKIIDTEKALILSDRQDFPHLQALKSKARLSVPFGPTVGFLKSNRRFIKQGKNYITMFSNEGQHLLPGDQVKIEIRNQISPILTLQ